MAAEEQDVESLEMVALREEVRAWIQQNRPPKPEFLEPENFMFVETNRQFEYLLEWQRKLFEAGYLGMEWPPNTAVEVAPPARRTWLPGSSRLLGPRRWSTSSVCSGRVQSFCSTAPRRRSCAC